MTRKVTVQPRELGRRRLRTPGDDENRRRAISNTGVRCRALVDEDEVDGFRLAVRDIELRGQQLLGGCATRSIFEGDGGDRSSALRTQRLRLQPRWTGVPRLQEHGVDARKEFGRVPGSSRNRPAQERNAPCPRPRRGPQKIRE